MFLLPFYSILERGGNFVRRESWVIGRFRIHRRLLMQDGEPTG